jgi:hypothetical protein
MPRIKSPFTPQERLYNQRYQQEIQIDWIRKIRMSDKYKQNADDYAVTFMIRIAELIARGKPLTDPQADFLADLYARYSE